MIAGGRRTQEDAGRTSWVLLGPLGSAADFQSLPALSTDSLGPILE